MAPQARLHNFNGWDLTVNELAKLRGCTTENMHHLIRKYGFPEAMEVPTRVAKYGGSHIKSACDVRLRGFNEKLERFRRLKNWLGQGMTREEIEIKESRI